MNGAKSDSVVLPAAKVAFVFPTGTRVEEGTRLADTFLFIFERISAARAVSPEAKATCASSNHEDSKQSK